jgi:uroporphyrinogen decarboxylase
MRFLDACASRPVDATPVWLMRQAGRYLPEYRAIRERLAFIEMCKRPDVAAEVTLQPLRRFDLDAAIVFADILLPLEPMGIGFTFTADGGPVIDHPIRSGRDVKGVRAIDPREELGYVMETLRLVRCELPATTALIGFAGAPFTLASYVVEGGHSRNYARVKQLMLGDP